MNFQQLVRRLFVLVLPAVLIPLATGAAGCLSAPEHCHGCLAAVLVDGGAVPPPDATTGNTGGSGTGGMGPLGTGGLAGAGPVGTGGIGSGGSGGLLGTGGRGTGGVAATGGAGTGGMGTGGAGTGGRGTGGSASGGAASGGSGTGGSVIGGRGGVPGTGGAAGSGLGGNGTDGDLVLWYKFDESSGTTAADAAMLGGTARPAMLATLGTGANAAFSTTRQVGSHAVSLTPAATLPAANLAFVTVPSLQALAPAAITISVWVNLRANTTTEAWERVFDFGSGKNAPGNIYLTARAGDAPGTPIRFAITNTGHTPTTAEQRIDGTAPLTPNAWHHIVVVLGAGSTYTGRLYVDNVAVGTNTMMSLHAAEVGATTTNWLGRSQFSALDGTNPGLNGFIDDFRVYRRALSTAEVAALFALR